jgi:hypothetical protein
MGSWDETCSLTRTGIGGGDPCVRVRFEFPHGERGTYLAKIATGEFPGILEEDYRSVAGIDVGHYDDYGMMKEDYHVRPECDHAVWFHREAWDFAAAWARRSIGRDLTPADWYGVSDQMRRSFERQKAQAERAGVAVSPYVLEQLRPWPERMAEFAAMSRLGRWSRRSVWAYERGPQGWNEEWEVNAEVQALSRKLLGAPLLALQREMVADGDDPNEYPFHEADPRTVFPDLTPTPAAR